MDRPSDLAAKLGERAGVGIGSPFRFLVRLESPPVQSLPSCGTPIMGINLKRLERGRVVGREDEEPMRNPSLFFSEVGAAFTHATRAVLPVLSAKLLAAFEAASGRSRANEGLVRIAHGWYATRELTPIETLQALMRITPADTVVAGETAGLLWGVEVRPTSSYGKQFGLCVARPEGERALRRPGLRCRVVRFEKGDRIVLNGVRCTSALRTAIDMAASSSLEIATHIFELFIRRQLVTFAQLRKRIDQLDGTRGVVVLREALELAHPGSESVFETAVRIRLVEAGLPEPTPQVPVRVPQKVNPFRLDLGWDGVGPRNVRVGVECDSDAHHPLVGAKAERDRARVREIEKQGWQVLSIRFAALRGPRMNFEVEAAQALGVQLSSTLRRRWTLSKWNLQRNAWVRTEDLQLALGRGSSWCEAGSRHH